MLKYIWTPFGYLLALIRAIIFMLWLIFCVSLLIITLPLAKNKTKYKNWAKKTFCQSSLFIFGIVLKSHFEERNLPKSGVLLISNHHSFSDPLLTLAYIAAKPVAKAEIRSYPIIGFATDFTGIIWVDRKNKTSRAGARSAIQDGLANRDAVLVYPEGTISWTSTKLRDFKVGAFRAAEGSEKPIVANAVKYHSESSFWQENTGMLAHYFRQFSKPIQKADIYFSKPMYGEASALKEECQQWIADKLDRNP